MIHAPSNCPRMSSWAAIVALTFAGCGNSNGLVPVTGRVLYKGRPASGARLHFHRQDSPATVQRDPIPSGLVDEGGNFELTTGDLGRGAPAGRYAVLVAWPEEAGAGRAGQKSRPGIEPGSKLNRTPLDRLKGRYLDGATPRIFAEVKPNSRELPPIELTD